MNLTISHYSRLHKCPPLEKKEGPLSSEEEIEQLKYQMAQLQKSMATHTHLHEMRF